MTQANLDFDICERKHGGVATSISANLRVDKETDRKMVYSLIGQARHGLTLDEISFLTDRMPNAISGRLTELAAKGLIYRTSETRKTRSGSPAKVWRIRA